MFKCFICTCEFKKNDANHIYRCAKKYNRPESKEQLRYLHINYNSKYPIDYDIIYDMYIIKEFSLVEISEYFNIPYSASEFLIKYFEIQLRDIHTANNIGRRQEKFKDTCLKIYGVDNPSKHDDIKFKKESTFIKNYGVNNIFAAGGERQRYHEIMVDKYGKGSVSNINGYNHSSWWKSISVNDKSQRISKLNTGYVKFWNNLPQDEKDNIISKRKQTWLDNGNISSVNGTSSLEVRLSSILQGLGISFVWQKWIDRKSFDFHILGTNIIIEVNGDYWHANPKKYDADDLISYPQGIKKYAKDIWELDYIKKTLALSYGYDVYYIWESDINIMSDDDIITWMRAKLEPNELFK